MHCWVRAGACVSLAWLGVSLAGCTGFEQRHGLKPIIDPVAVVSASNNTTIILSALARDAGVPNPSTSDDWYQVAEAGFNYIDDQCRSYFDTLFFLNRGREQIKAGLSTAAQTTAAILGVTGASATSLAVVAQAFGFGVNATDLLAGTYLYGLPPATTHGFVQKLQSAFREGAAANRTAINRPTAAYYMVQRYLDLCLPPRIEAEITKQISSAGTVGVQRGEGALFSLETFSEPPTHALNPPAGPLVNGQSAVPNRRVASSEVGGATTRPRSSDVPPAPPKLQFIRGAITPVEETISHNRGQAIQQTLCVPGTGDFGGRASPTRVALRDFNAARLYPTDAGAGEVIATDQDLRRLTEAQRQFGSCKEAGFANGFEVGIFARNGSDGVRRNLGLALRAAGLAAPAGLEVSGTPPMNAATRNAVTDLRGKYGLPGTTIDRAFYHRLMTSLER